MFCDTADICHGSEFDDFVDRRDLFDIAECRECFDIENGGAGYHEFFLDADEVESFVAILERDKQTGLKFARKMLEQEGPYEQYAGWQCWRRTCL